MRKLINDGWFFAKLPPGSTLSDAEKAGFEPVDLPHDWLIWQENDLYETADAWYRRTLDLQEGPEPVVMIRFDGVYMDCDVLLNGQVVFQHPYGYTAFDVPLTGRLQKGENILMVHIRHQSPNTRWYSGSGIYRDVFLVTLPEYHIIPDSLYLKESEENGQWKLDVSARVSGGTGIPFSCTLTDPDGSQAAYADGFPEEGAIKASVNVPKARLWSPDDPCLYQLIIRYGEQTEVKNVGIRSVSIHPDKGLFLNGERIRLRGVCLHHDLGALGSAFHEKAARRQLQLMKDMGANAVRTSHNPPASKFLDLCDEMGFLVIDEAFDMWERPKTQYDYARFFPEWYERDVESWIRRDRCHPCVIMWSIGNEIYDMHAGRRGEELTGILTRLVRRYDPMRHAFVTFGCNYMPWTGGQQCAEHVDIVGYNYGETCYDLHHSLHPSWVIYGSETASILSSRGVYHFPIEQDIMSDEDMQCSSLGNSNTSWGADSLKKIVVDDIHHPFSLGQFIWSGIDYIGEPTPYQTRSCYFGQADTACFPKDPYYLLQSLWTDRKMIHIGVSWDWNTGQIIDIPVMTNCAEAELILNGQSAGRKRNDEHLCDRFPLLWKEPFVPGEIIARGYDEEGRMICEDIRSTPGETDHLVLSGEQEHLLSDGWDIAFVTVSAADRSGRMVENARDRVKVSVSGGGRLIGTDNGDPADTDGYKSSCRKLFSGKLLLIIGSNGLPRDVIVRVGGYGMKEAYLKIPVKKAPVLPGVSFGMEIAERPYKNTLAARRIDIRATGPTALTKDHPECTFRYSVLPGQPPESEIIWQVTNNKGIESPHVQVTHNKESVTVCARADGEYLLRALYRENGKCAFISQIGFSASGFGTQALDPYTYISAGLYDLHDGGIGSGNEKGIAFARDGLSMIGFSRVDFGETGSDTVTMDLFALDDDAYEMELYSIGPSGDEHRIGILRYQKPCIWNVYQTETWSLPERLTGVQTVCFRMKKKIHMKGFIFEKQLKAYLPHRAGSADRIYGDCFHRTADSVTGIGNNVTLSWSDMDFDGQKEAVLEIEGRTSLAVNTVSVRIRNDRGEETTEAADFIGNGKPVQTFRIKVPEGSCTVSFVFLPGCSFDFDGFRFCRTETGQT